MTLTVPSNMPNFVSGDTGHNAEIEMIISNRSSKPHAQSVTMKRSHSTRLLPQPLNDKSDVQLQKTDAVFTDIVKKVDNINDIIENNAIMRRVQNLVTNLNLNGKIVFTDTQCNKVYSVIVSKKGFLTAFRSIDMNKVIKEEESTKNLAPKFEQLRVMQSNLLQVLRSELQTKYKTCGSEQMVESKPAQSNMNSSPAKKGTLAFIRNLIGCPICPSTGQLSENQNNGGNENGTNPPKPRGLGLIAKRFSKKIQMVNGYNIMVDGMEIDTPCVRLINGRFTGTKRKPPTTLETCALLCTKGDNSKYTHPKKKLSTESKNKCKECGQSRPVLDKENSHRSGCSRNIDRTSFSKLKHKKICPHQKKCRCRKCDSHSCDSSSPSSRSNGSEKVGNFSISKLKDEKICPHRISRKKYHKQKITNGGCSECTKNPCCKTRSQIRKLIEVIFKNDFQNSSSSDGGKSLTEPSTRNHERTNSGEDQYKTKREEYKENYIPENSNKNNTIPHTESKELSDDISSVKGPKLGHATKCFIPAVQCKHTKNIIGLDLGEIRNQIKRNKMNEKNIGDPVFLNLNMEKQDKKYLKKIEKYFENFPSMSDKQISNIFSNNKNIRLSRSMLCIPLDSEAYFHITNEICENQKTIASGKNKEANDKIKKTHHEEDNQISSNSYLKYRQRDHKETKKSRDNGQIRENHVRKRPRNYPFSSIRLIVDFPPSLYERALGHCPQKQEQFGNRHTYDSKSKDEKPLIGKNERTDLWTKAHSTISKYWSKAQEHTSGLMNISQQNKDKEYIQPCQICQRECQQKLKRIDGEVVNCTPYIGYFEKREYDEFDKTCGSRHQGQNRVYDDSFDVFHQKYRPKSSDFLKRPSACIESEKSRERFGKVKQPQCYHQYHPEQNQCHHREHYGTCRNRKRQEYQTTCRKCREAECKDGRFDQYKQDNQCDQIHQEGKYKIRYSDEQEFQPDDYRFKKTGCDCSHCSRQFETQTQDMYQKTHQDANYYNRSKNLPQWQIQPDYNGRPETYCKCSRPLGECKNHVRFQQYHQKEFSGQENYLINLILNEQRQQQMDRFSPKNGKQLDNAYQQRNKRHSDEHTYQNKRPKNCNLQREKRSPNTRVQYEDKDKRRPNKVQEKIQPQESSTQEQRSQKEQRHSRRQNERTTKSKKENSSWNNQKINLFVCRKCVHSEAIYSLPSKLRRLGLINPGNLKIDDVCVICEDGNPTVVPTAETENKLDTFDYWSKLNASAFPSNDPDFSLPVELRAPKNQERGSTRESHYWSLKENRSSGSYGDDFLIYASSPLKPKPIAKKDLPYDWGGRGDILIINENMCYRYDIFSAHCLQSGMNPLNKLFRS